ncbi:hypothetical protein AVW16_09135 [Crenobacter luteus]|uniref:GGDEF domain-containing protein n=1 Tax=Crenobacter luteus TaxID=1452487 RepID=A0A165FHT1_9NEIS|nr:hypothetical protein AVW16_09135 [Crenobacter luteus]
MRPLLLLGGVLWLAMTALIAAAFVSRAVRHAEQMFERHVQQIADGVGQRVLANEAVLDAYAAYTLVDGPSPGEEERLYTRQMMRRYPQIVAMERVERVPGAERGRVERYLAERYGPAVTLFGFDHQTRRVVEPLPPRDEYFPVLFVEPMTVGGARVIGLDVGYADFQRETLLASVDAGHAVASRPYPLIEGQTGYLLMRPADTAGAPRRFVGMVVNSELFAPQRAELPDGMRVRLWHSRYGPDDRHGRFFDKAASAARSPLETLLFPRLTATRRVGSDSQPFMLDASWQLGWSQLGAFEWGLMALLSAGLLAATGLGLSGALRRHERRRAREDHLFRLANYDTLTGLPNRLLFYDRLQHAISGQPRSGRRLAVLFLDLNRFKPVNDTYGHAAGDAVLKVLAQRLTGALRAEDTVARLGGDEFVVLLERVGGNDDVDTLVVRLKNVVGQPIEVDGRSVVLGVSVGVAYYPEDGLLIDELLAAADRKMYGSKGRAAAAR